MLYKYYFIIKFVLLFFLSVLKGTSILLPRNVNKEPGRLNVFGILGTTGKRLQSPKWRFFNAKNLLNNFIFILFIIFITIYIILGIHSMTLK